MHTADLAKENYEKLAALFPNAVTETIDEEGHVVRAIIKMCSCRKSIRRS